MILVYFCKYDSFPFFVCCCRNCLHIYTYICFEMVRMVLFLLAVEFDFLSCNFSFQEFKLPPSWLGGVGVGEGWEGGGGDRHRLYQSHRQ